MNISIEAEIPVAEPAPPEPTSFELDIQEASQKLARLNDRALAFARERPGTCVIAAVTLGFIVGKIAARY